MAHTFRLERVPFPLTDAQVKALPTTPITLLAAQGSGYRIKVLGMTVKAVIVGAYTNINATYSSLQIEHPTAILGWIITDSGASLTDLNTVLGTVQTTTTDVAQAVLTSWTALAVPMLSSATDNTLIRISLDNSGSGNLTGGNAGNSVTVMLTYLVEPV